MLFQYFIDLFLGAGLYDPSLLDSIFEFGEPEYNFFQLSNFFCPHNDRSLRHCTHSIEFDCPPAVIMCAYGKMLKALHYNVKLLIITCI